MVIKAVFAAATPATPSSTIIISTRYNHLTTIATTNTITARSLARNPRFIAAPRWTGRYTSVRHYRAWPSYGVTTPSPNDNHHQGQGQDHSTTIPISRSPFYFETGYALCAKRPSRPFPPPFLSPPSSSFSEPLTTHYQSQDKRLSVRGERIRGLNNGDDAVLVAPTFLGVNDGVGAWATRTRGHAG